MCHSYEGSSADYYGSWKVAVSARTTITQGNYGGLPPQAVDQAYVDIETLDSDGDGYANWAEILAGKRPGDPSDHPTFTSVGAPTGVIVAGGNTQAIVNFSPGSSGGAAATMFTVTASPGGMTAKGLSSPILVTGLANGTPYTFTVAASNGFGATAVSTASSSVTPAGSATTPTLVSAKAGGTQATVSFVEPTNGSVINGTLMGYTVTSSPGGIAASGYGSPILVQGLTNAVSYTFTVEVTNSGLPSVASNAVTPLASLATAPESPNCCSFVDSGDRMAILAFNPPSDGGSPITSYAAICTYTSGAGIPLSFTVSSPAPSIMISGLNNGTTYKCGLTATNAAGTSRTPTNPSDFNAQFIPHAPAPPSVPTSITVTPGNGQATIAFGPPASDGGSAVLDYSASCKTGDTTIGPVTGTASPLTVTGLTNGTAYACWVTARNAEGTFNALAFRPDTLSVTPTTATAPAAPTSVNAAGGNAQATVSFTPSSSDGGSAITGYIVTANPGFISAAGQGSPISVTGLTNGISYTFTVAATNVVGSSVSAASNAVTPVAPIAIPAAPTGVIASITGTGLLVTTSWNTVAGATSYNVYMANAPGVTKANYASLAGGHVHPGATSPFAPHSGTPGVPYYIVVTAVNSAGESAISTEVSVSVPSTTTTAPTTTTTSVGSTTTTTQVPATTTTTAAPTTTTVQGTTTTTLAPATLSFIAGWNLVGNSSSTALDVATAFGDTAKTLTIWKWVASTTKWAFYAPSLVGSALSDYAASKGYDVLTTINGGEGFWVNAKLAFTTPLPAGAPVVSASFQNMISGWNLVATGDDKTPSQFNVLLSTTPPAGDIPVNLTTLWAWDAGLTNWYFYAASLEKNGGLSSYVASKSYLDFGTKTLDPAMGFWVNKP